jgi:hypothetical protein
VCHLTNRRQHKARARDKRQLARSFALAEEHRRIYRETRQKLFEGIGQALDKNLSEWLQEHTFTPPEAAYECRLLGEFPAAIEEADRKMSELILGQSLTNFSAGSLEFAKVAQEARQRLFDSPPQAFPLGTFSNRLAPGQGAPTAESIPQAMRKLEEVTFSRGSFALREIRVLRRMPALGRFKDQGVMYLGYEAFDKLVAGLPDAKGQLGPYLGVPVYDDRTACPSPPVCQFDETPEEPCNC